MINYPMRQNGSIPANQSAEQSIRLIQWIIMNQYDQLSDETKWIDTINYLMEQNESVYLQNDQVIIFQPVNQPSQNRVHIS